MKNLITLVFFFISFSSQATDIYWGGSVGDWDVATNWVGDIIPTASDEVIIINGRAIVPSNYIALAKEIFVSSTGELLISKAGKLIIDGQSRGNGGIVNFNKIYNYGWIEIDKIKNTALRNTGVSALFINKKGGTLNIGATSIEDLGISNFSSATFKNYGQIIIKNCSNNGISTRLSALFLNQGSLNIDIVGANGVSISSSSTFKNKLSGSIDIGETSIGESGIYNSLSSLFLNNGTIVIDNTQSSAISNSDAIFKNFISGSIIIENTLGGYYGIYNQLEAHFLNRGSISIENMYWSINNYLLSTFLNTQTGVISIGAELGGTIGLTNTSNANFDNSGEIYIGDIEGNGLSNITGTFTNSSCGTLTLTSRVATSSSIFNNYGLLSQNFNGSNYSDALTFTNHGIIEDIQGSFDPASMVNNGYLVAPITASVYENVSLQSVLTGTGTGLTFPTNYFYTDNTLNTEAGSFMQLNNTWTPNANAVNHDIFYMEIDNGSGCPRIVEIHTNNPVSLVRHEGGKNDIKQTHVPKSISKAVEVGYSVYPNPSAGSLILKSGHTTDESIEVFISNVNGQIVFQKAFDHLNTKTSILEGNSNFAPGIYFLMVKQNGKIIGQEKVVFY